MSRQHWHRLFGLALLVMALLSAVLLYYAHQHWQQQALLHSSQQNEQVALHMETLLDGLQNHVKRLQHSAHLALHAEKGEPALRQFLQPSLPEGSAGYSLDVLQQTTPSAQIGNVYLGLPPDTASIAPELKVIWALFPLAASSHLTDSALQWSYYNSLQSPLLGVFPYRSTERLLRDAKVADLPTFFRQFIGPEAQRNVIAQIGDKHEPHWRAPHIDAAGAGWVVPLVAAVRQQGNIIGVVSADVRLSFLSEHLSKLTTAPERTLLMDDEQRVLADSRLSLETNSRLERLAERVPASLVALVPSLTRDQPGWSSASDYHVMLRPLAHSQWSLVRLTPSDELLFDVRLRVLVVALPLILLQLALALLWWRRREHHRFPLHD